MLNLLPQGMVWGACSQARMPRGRLCPLVPPSLQTKVVLMGCCCWQHPLPWLVSQSLCHVPEHSPRERCPHALAVLPKVGVQRVPVHGTAGKVALCDGSTCLAAVLTMLAEVTGTLQVKVIWGTFQWALNHKILLVSLLSSDWKV